MPPATPPPGADPAPAADPPRSLRRLVILLAVGAVLIAVTGAVLQLLSERAELPWGVGAVVTQGARLLSPNVEGNVWSWYSTVLIAVLGVAFVIIAIVTRRGGGDGRPYIALAVIAVALSIDESSQIHENFSLITGELGIETGFTYNWLLVGIPLAVVVGALLLWVTRRIDRRLRNGLVLGGAVYLAGAAGMEALGGIVTRSLDTEAELGAALLSTALMLVEELAELSGVLHRAGLRARGAARAGRRGRRPPAAQRRAARRGAPTGLSRTGAHM